MEIRPAVLKDLDAIMEVYYYPSSNFATKNVLKYIQYARILLLQRAYFQ